MCSNVEGSILDFASLASADLEGALNVAATDEQKDDLILDHIKQLCNQGKTVLDPDENAEWAWSTQDMTLYQYCTGRVVLLDFFTYCCINCHHVLPDLKDLENMYIPEDGFLVIGVHSAKFDAEQHPENVKRAAKKLNITHPILNDPQAVLWNRLGIHCWPTLVLLSPEGKPILVLAGEGHRDTLFRCVAVAMSYFKEQNAINPTSTEFLKLLRLTISNKDFCSLSYPGKVCVNTFTNQEAGKPYLTFSDSSNNRIVITDPAYKILLIVGSLEPGFKDGPLVMAKFNNPQGMCWIDADTLVVCDTGNHALRKISLSTSTVELLAGTGVQGEFGDQGGGKYCQQALSSPWDIILYQTPDMDMSLRSPLLKKDDKNNSDKSKDSKEGDDIRRVLLIAAAGSHQIWAMFLDTTVWWKYKTYSEGTVIPIVGSGREENRNNRYPNAAGLAQPSGLAISYNLLYIADSESSTIRKLDLSSGQLYPLVGGDKNPCNLFAFGDIDGTGFTVRLQHPLGVAACPKTSAIYIADSYNHKIKKVDPVSTECTTYYPTTNAKVNISEPGGLCFSEDGSTIYVADTNSNRIISINALTRETSVLKFVFPETKRTNRATVEDYRAKDLVIFPTLISVCSARGSKLQFTIHCEVAKTDKGLHLTPQAPQRWTVKFHTAKDKKKDLITDWDVSGCTRSGKEFPVHFEATLKSAIPDGEKILRIEYVLSLCEGGLCFMRRFASDLVLGFKSDSPSISKHNFKILVNSDHNIVIERVS